MMRGSWRCRRCGLGLCWFTGRGRCTVWGSRSRRGRTLTQVETLDAAFGALFVVGIVAFFTNNLTPLLAAARADLAATSPNATAPVCPAGCRATSSNTSNPLHHLRALRALPGERALGGGGGDGGGGAEPVRRGQLHSTS